MSLDQKLRFIDMAAHGKYRRLFMRLRSQPGREWRTTFKEIEEILGFHLPMSARLYRPWWANQKNGSGHSHALAWTAAGWKTAEVDMEAETLVFRSAAASPRPPEEVSQISLDEILPVHFAGGWPEGLSLRREDIYEDRL